MLSTSLIMSTGAEFGSHMLLPEHGIFLHNRGMGFSLQPGHPAEYGPRRRRPDTLTPLVITDAAGTLDTVLGTMGADGPPIIRLERGVPATWKAGLVGRGYQVAEAPPDDHTFGHAQVIRLTDDGLFCGAADPRSGDGACVGR
jgi:gamma-glutamyltranspeptidase/glutathione hydrolase